MIEVQGPRSLPHQKAGAKNYVRLTIQDWSNYIRYLPRIVFEIGILNDHYFTLGEAKSGLERFRFPSVPLVAYGVNYEMPQTQLLKYLPCLIGRTIIDNNDLKQARHSNQFFDNRRKSIFLVVNGNDYGQAPLLHSSSLLLFRAIEGSG
jgi:hypothetical protein